MIIGHYAVAMAAKRAAPKTSLGTLIAAAAFLDLLWPVLLLLGAETVVIAPGATPFTPLAFISYPWSHSLLTSAIWGLLFGGGYYAISGYGRGAAAVALLVPSHWLLDYIVHAPDLPLVPWSEAKYGLGLWNSVGETLAVELGIFAIGILFYISITRGRDRIGSLGFLVFLVLMLALYGGAVFGPPPPSVDAIAWTDMGQWLFIALAAWIDRHRAIRR
jgi:hypothetical protein